MDVFLARPKVCPTDIVRPHAAQLMIDTSVDQFCKILFSAEWPLSEWQVLAVCLYLRVPGWDGQCEGGQGGICHCARFTSGSPRFGFCQRCQQSVEHICRKTGIWELHTTREKVRVSWEEINYKKQQQQQQQQQQSSDFEIHSMNL